MTNSISTYIVSISPNRYNEFEIDLISATTSFSTVGTYTYEAFFYDGVGATGSCLEKGMLKVNGLSGPDQFTRENDDNFIYIRNNS